MAPSLAHLTGGSGCERSGWLLSLGAPGGGEAPRIDEASVYGLTSTVIWAMVVVVCVLYVGVLLRRDNEGEGGLLALLALLRAAASSRRVVVVTTFIGIAGAALFLGDSVVTPAISVLSAAEGLKIVAPSAGAAVLPAALVVLLGVFVLQRVGTGRIGRFYGPVMLAWFLVIAVAGVGALLQHPAALQALSPTWAVRYAADDPLAAFLALGSVVLTVTGAEALYADLGHFGRAAITRSWFVLVFPCLRARHTSEQQGGQIYLPSANWVLCAAVLGVVLGFRSSSALSSAYGVAVSATILTTVTLFVVLARHEGRRGLAATALVPGLVVLVVFAATLRKVPTGGWLPVLLGLVMFVAMWTWWAGRRRLAAARAADECPLTEVLEGADRPHRHEGTAVFLTDDGERAPFALRFLLEREDVVHEHTVILSWQVDDKPSADPHGTKVDVEAVAADVDELVGIDVTMGYRDRLDVEDVLQRAGEHEPDVLAGVDPDEATYFVSEPIPRLSRHGTLPRWQQRLFVAMHRLATDRVEQLALPRDRTLVVGKDYDL